MSIDNNINIKILGDNFAIEFIWVSVKMNEIKLMLVSTLIYHFRQYRKLLVTRRNQIF